MAEEDLDLVIHLGDYIYEHEPGQYRVSSGSVRSHNGRQPRTLEDYRNRHALYKSDPHLQRAHAAFPWVVVWDDHEVENNYAGEIAEKGEPRSQFIRRRAAAYRADYEHMPLRSRSMPRQASLQLYRRFHYGNLVDLHLLDTRQYRDDQANGDGWKPPAGNPPIRTGACSAMNRSAGCCGAWNNRRPAGMSSPNRFSSRRRMSASVPASC